MPIGCRVARSVSPEGLQKLLQVYGVYSFTQKTITEPALIHEELARVRERGYAAEFEETVAGGCCFGVPVGGKREPVHAAVSISLPIIRLTKRLEERIPQMLVEAGARITKRLTRNR